MDAPESALPALVDSLLLESAPPRPPRPPSPPVDSSTPIGRAIAGFYLAIEAVDESDRTREVADWWDRQNALLEWRRKVVDTSASEQEGLRQLIEHSGRVAPYAKESRRKYIAIAHGITHVETVRRHARSKLGEIAATATRTRELLERCEESRPADINAAVHVAIRREVIAVTEAAVRQINDQTRLVLNLDRTTATTAVEDWLARHDLVD
ncbi:MAG: hypothetical protein ACRDUS_19425 [Mycobacterium sp.]